MLRQLVYGLMSKSLNIKIYVWPLHGVYMGLESTYKMCPGNPGKTFPNNCCAVHSCDNNNPTVCNYGANNVQGPLWLMSLGSKYCLRGH